MGKAFRLNGTYYHTSGAADELGCTDSRVRQLIGENELKAIQLSPRSYLISSDEVERYREEKATGRKRTHRPKPSRTTH